MANYETDSIVSESGACLRPCSVKQTKSCGNIWRARIPCSMLARFDQTKVSERGGVFVVNWDCIRAEVSLQAGVSHLRIRKRCSSVRQWRRQICFKCLVRAYRADTPTNSGHWVEPE